MVHRSLVALALSASLGLGVGCADGNAVPPQTPAKAAPTAAPKASADEVPTTAPGHLRRAEVESVLRQGPPWLLQRVVPEEVIRGGKFVGWRILSLPPDWKVDLQSGDVVTKVNGLSIERPDDLWAAWMQLQSAVELRVAYERDGQPRELVLPIDGPSSAGAPAPEMMTQPPPPKPRSKWSTVVISGDEPPPDEND